MADEVLSDADRIKQLDTMFWEYTKQLDLLEYKIKMQAEFAALIWMKDEPRFDETRRLIAERDALMKLRSVGITEATELTVKNPQACIDAHKDTVDVH